MCPYAYTLALFAGIVLYFYSKWSTFKNYVNMIKIIFKIYVIMMFKNILSKLEGNNYSENQNTIIFKDTHVHITYQFNGDSHNIRMPYHPKNKLKMHKMILLINDEEIDITHKHGLPYHLSAKDLGGDKIIYKKGEDIIKEFKDEEIPNI